VEAGRHADRDQIRLLLVDHLLIIGVIRDVLAVADPGSGARIRIRNRHQFDPIHFPVDAGVVLADAAHADDGCF